MARHHRLIHRASIISQEGDCNFAIGAVIARGNCILATGYCKKKTHPRNPKLKNPAYLRTVLQTQLCAEFAAALRMLNILPREKIRGCKLYVARRKRDGSSAMAKPCKSCQSFLKEIGIKDVFYTNHTGVIEHMEI